VRVIIITPASPAHHKHLCAYLAERHDVVGVINPVGRMLNRHDRLEKARQAFSSFGVTYLALRTLGARRNPLMGWNWIAAFEDAEARFFADAELRYRRADIGSRTYSVEDVNGASTITLLRDLAPDAVVCLGGPIYREALVDVCGTMVNIHSGISPLYNGASTIMFAFANGHVHLCGGTLMTMSNVVDGGDILAHYLPAIVEDDDPATLFMKTVRGACEASSRFLKHLEAEGRFSKAPQHSPLFYCTSESWTVHQTQRVRLHLERRTAAKHIRSEDLRVYWDKRTDGEAASEAKATVERLLGTD